MAYKRHKVDIMRVILNLNENTLSDLQKLADTENRSRKNLMEHILTLASCGNNPVVQRNLPQVPKSNFVLPVVKVSQYEAFCAEIIDCRETSDIEQIMRVVKTDKELSGTDKLKLEKIAMERGLYLSNS